MTTKIQKKIEESIDEKIGISEITAMPLDRFIKDLKSLNRSSNELEIVLNLLKGDPRTELIDRPIMFNKFADKLYIKLVKWPIIYNC